MSQTICVIGLGYVGLPLAVALSKNFETYGFDVDQSRVEELRGGYDRTNEIEDERMRDTSLVCTSSIAEIPPADFYIVTVPTPIDDAKNPDLSLVRKASETVGDLLKDAAQAGKKPIIVFESTVYPSVTERICAPILSERSGLAWKKDFFVGYSPERINPGDREHTIDKITKVVSGDTEETLDAVARLYDCVTSGGTFRAASIRAAEAAKVIENAQRDINIAFINEVTRIFGMMGLSVWDVLDAAKTKWNFLEFTPGLVGGHCIGVDPYYLAHRAREVGHDPAVILAGRTMNDTMPGYIASQLSKAAGQDARNALVLGMTFKENVPDLRNSKVVDLISELKSYRLDVTVHDPLADPAEAMREYGVELDDHALDRTYDLVLLAVPHGEYLEMGADRLLDLINEHGVAADLKNALRHPAFWRL
ncbi:nucleotide sugar dehydrogenase [Aurantiacibacter aquimixticola]|uniref:Nucleotide sugar dehydrogenase n=1 Tax=Aurantiacibacter aquimixticola TaxID=1958945 RepID=A0A419RSE8_9SPHN|nr:nucleotide sugar dehydrogenase [Aurantiacibacter aquimixticola]RJY08722.1 nucleotide sugar dehydrogenase [Aurantiacibacter aquimixticola]